MSARVTHRASLRATASNRDGGLDGSVSQLEHGERVRVPPAPVSADAVRNAALQDLPAVGLRVPVEDGAGT